MDSKVHVTMGDHFRYNSVCIKFCMCNLRRIAFYAYSASIFVLCTHTV